jgi:hypothetical protein
MERSLCWPPLGDDLSRDAFLLRAGMREDHAPVRPAQFRRFAHFEPGAPRLAAAEYAALVQLIGVSSGV